MNFENKDFSASILTRTRNRNALLRRAAESVASQTIDHLQWVVVNDGGEPTSVQEIVASIASDRISVKTIHHDVSKGRSAAANAAVAKSDAPLMLFLDDDDTLAPGCVSALKSACDANMDCVGAVGASVKINERENADGRIEEVGRSDFFRPTVSLSIVDVGYRNPTAINALMFRKSVAEKIGGFNNDIDHLEDWDFLLRLLLEGDICACPSAESYFHQRLESVGATANSAVARDEDGLVRRRNAYLREDIAAGRAGLGLITNTRDPVSADRLSKLLEMISGIGAPVKSVKKLLARRPQGNQEEKPR